jgi:hypothetical protein
MDRQPPESSSGSDGTPAEVRELLGWLQEEACTFCRAEADGGARYWFWYLNEHYGESGTLAQLRASLGFCARHTEELLVRATPSTITTVYRYLLPPFARLLSEGEQVTGPQAGCPACAAERDSPDFRMQRLVRHQGTPGVQDALERSASPCLPHALTLAGRLRRAPLVHQLDVVRGRLQRAAGDDLGRLLEPGDPGAAPASAAGWAAAGAEDRPALPTLDRLAGLLAAPFCPGCLAAHEGSAHYLAWLPRMIRREQFPQWADAIWLCRAHHGQLARADGPATDRLLDHTRHHWAARITELLDLLEPDRAPDPARHAPGDTGLWRRLRSTDRKARDAAARVLAARPCPACLAAATARTRLAELLVAALGDPRTAERYQAGVGLCYQDLRAALALQPPAAVARLLRGTLGTRLSLLLWELEERSRRETWHVRHEGKGPEQSAWKRAVRQFSGGVG